jgi:transcriptional regulator with XRE-family HTH domain
LICQEENLIFSNFPLEMFEFLKYNIEHKEVIPVSKTRNAELKDRLREALEVRHMRAVDLVEKADVPKSAISFYLAGKSQPKADRLYKIAQALDVSETWLLGYDVPMLRTAEQKKNDQLAQLIVRMRTDKRFYDNVAALAALSEKQYKTIEDLIAAFNE